MHKAVPDVLLLVSFSCREGVTCGQFFITIKCFMKSMFRLSISCRESVACGQYFITIECFMNCLF